MAVPFASKMDERFLRTITNSHTDMPSPPIDLLGMPRIVGEGLIWVHMNTREGASDCNLPIRLRVVTLPITGYYAFSASVVN
jgi:hypothetical protein